MQRAGAHAESRGTRLTHQAGKNGFKPGQQAESRGTRFTHQAGKLRGADNRQRAGAHALHIRLGRPGQQAESRGTRFTHQAGKARLTGREQGHTQRAGAHTESRGTRREQGHTQRAGAHALDIRLGS